MALTSASYFRAPISKFKSTFLAELPSHFPETLNEFSREK